MCLCFYVALQNPLHELALGLVVGLAVITKSDGKLPLKKSIGIRIRGVRPKMIPERDMALVFSAVWRAYIQVMVNSVGLCSEGFTSAYTQIASVLVSHVP